MGIAERIREERARLGLSQAEFAEIAGAHRKSQGNYESGERSPDAQYLAAIAEAGADVCYIVTGDRGAPMGGTVDFDAVLDRMYAATGESFTSHSEAFGVPEQTLAAWRKRGAVSPAFLRQFAAERGVSIDYLLYGRNGTAEVAPPYDALTVDERTLLERYRAAPPGLRRAALRVLLGDE